MPDLLYRDDPYLPEVTATVTAAGPDGVELDRTVFYASSGGQPGDTGCLILADGRQIAISGTVHPEGDRMRNLHLTGRARRLPQPGETVTLRLDWERRHRLMRMHTALHLLSVGLPYGVTGGQIGEDKGRLDFDMPEPPENIAEVEARLNAWVAAGLPVTAEWITEAELEARPDMVKTMKVKPPSGQGGSGSFASARAPRPSTSSPAAARMFARPPRSGRFASARSRRRAGKTAAFPCTSPTDADGGRSDGALPAQDRRRRDRSRSGAAAGG